MSLNLNSISLLSVFLPERNSPEGTNIQESTTVSFCLPMEAVEMARKMLSIAKLLATNAKCATKALRRRDLKAFDALVGDYGCQLRGAKIIDLTNSSAILEESKMLMEMAEKVEKTINNLSNAKSLKNLTLKVGMTIEQFFEQQQIGLKASSEMIFLLQAHLLTVTKEIYHAQNGEEGEEHQSSNWKSYLN